VLGAACLATAAGWQAAALAAEHPAPLYTASPHFRIPFQFDRAEMTRLGAVEVQLHVSTDRGGSWKAADAVSPAAQKFTFQAPQNGEYWFAVRTIDLQGQHHPPGALAPGLVVVVDDVRPTLALTVAAAGQEAELQWQIDDAHPDPSTLRLELLDPATGGWREVPAPAALRGTTRAAIGGGGGRLQARGTVSDRAGNQTTAEASAATTYRPAGDQRLERPDFREPIAGPAGALTGGAGEPGVAANLPQILPNVPQLPVPGRSLTTEAALLREANATPGLTVPPGLAAPGLTVPGSTAPGLVPPGLAVPGAGLLPVPSPVGIPGQSLLHSPSLPPLQPQSLPTPAAGFPPSTLAASPGNVRRINARTFRIGYEVKDIGPSGLGSVDLYISEDQGRKWFHYGTDPDRASPFEVTVPRDGQYGFAIRVRNGQGIVADPPQPNSPPEIAVLVDQTPPVARLLPLQQSAQGGVYEIRIAWFAQDESLAERPVALSESANPDGPWTPITGWIENQGRYVWQVTSLSPRRVYIRLEVRDQAGNVGSSMTDQPLLIDTSRPSARILDIEPTSPSPAGR